ncbi:hypothetical protein ES703_86375 [subsurface metagenome]
MLHNFWGELAEAYYDEKTKKMGLEIHPDDLDWKIQQAYDDGEYDKANQLLEIRKKLFPDSGD